MRPFILLIIAHLLGDLVFTSHRLALLKRSYRYSDRFLGLIVHGLIHGLFAGALLFFGDFDWIRGAAFVFILHGLIDLIRSTVEIRLYGTGSVYVKRSEFKEWVMGRGRNPDKMNLKNLAPWFMINILDQGFHVISLYVISINI